MPKNARQAALDRLAVTKDKVRLCLQQRDDLQVQACREMLKALDAGATRSQLAVLWDTSFTQVSRMIERARAEL